MKHAMLTAKAAEKMGFRQLTTEYVPAEQWMLDNVIADMRMGSIPFVLVRSTDGVQIWRLSHRTPVRSEPIEVGGRIGLIE